LYRLLGLLFRARDLVALDVLIDGPGDGVSDDVHRQVIDRLGAEL
jgi:hypothetical protein